MARRVFVLAASLLAITLLKTDSTTAQAVQDPSLRLDALTLTQPVVLAGPDVGFRIVRMDGQIPVGQIVVRINGAWIAAQMSR